LFSNNSNIFVVDEETAAASEAASAFIMKCWHRKPVIVGDEIVSEWVERLVRWDEIKVDVDLQTVVAFDYIGEAAKLLEEVKTAKLARIAAREAAIEHASVALEHDLRERVFRFVLNDDEDGDYMGCQTEWFAINGELLAINCGLSGKHPDVAKVFRFVHLIESAKAGKPVGFNYKNLAEIGHHIFHQHPDLLMAYGFMLRAFGTKSALDRDDRTGNFEAKIKGERHNFRSNIKYQMAEDEERLLAFLSQGASRKSQMANDNRNQDGSLAAA
jgi:hypothetical protein